MNATEAKRRVLAVHPGAYAYHWRASWTIYAAKDGPHQGHALADAPTRNEAWIAAAAGLKEERK